VPALQNFFRDERIRRGWSVRDAAQRSKISPSKAYAIENGDDNVEFETFENIATAFNMTPAELATAIGKGTPEDDPAHAEVVALYRAVPAEKKPAAIDMLRGLTVEPARQRAKSRTDGTAKRLEQRRRELLTGTETVHENESRRRKLSITKSSDVREHWLGSLLAILRLNRDSRQFSGAA
jgi:transcriptional regulator with XRE-family HTH domain